MRFRGDIMLLVFGILLIMKPQTFAVLLMHMVQIFENAFGSIPTGDSGEQTQSFQDDMRQFRSQVADPRKQFHDQFAL